VNVPRLIAEFTFRTEPTVTAPVLEVIQYDQAAGRVLAMGRGMCPLWFDLDRLRIMPGDER
jgi:hypothetical protein